MLPARVSFSLRSATRLLFVASSVLAACSGSERKFGEGSGGTASVAGFGGGSQGGASAGGATMTNSAGEAGSVGEAGSAGEASSAGEAGSAGEINAGCDNDSQRCADSMTPAKCVAGTWIVQERCPASKPACNSGLCAAATLSGGIATVSDGVLSTSSVRLVEHGLEYTQTTCGTVGTQRVCVTGGIRP